MSEKVDRCKYFLMTGRARAVPYYKECKVCPLRNKEGDCLDDIVNDTSSEAGVKIASIWCDYWKDYYEKRNREATK